MNSERNELPRHLRHPLAVVMLASAVPYLGLLGLLAAGHSSAADMNRPAAAVLTAFVVAGGLVPLVVVGLAFFRAIRDTSRFQPSLLIELYAGFIVGFASSYALVQCTSADLAFSGAPVLWTDDAGASFSVHADRLHSVFGCMLYLSIMTMTTVGYGDIAPVSASARILTSAQALCGVSFVSISVGHYFAVCSRRR